MKRYLYLKWTLLDFVLICQGIQNDNLTVICEGSHILVARTNIHVHHQALNISGVDTPSLRKLYIYYPSSFSDKALLAYISCCDIKCYYFV